MKKEECDVWLITCKLCNWEWEAYSKKIAENPECPKCGYKKCNVKKVDPALVRKQGEIIGFVEYDPIRDEVGNVWDKAEDGKFRKREYE